MSMRGYARSEKTLSWILCSKSGYDVLHLARLCIIPLSLCYCLSARISQKLQYMPKHHHISVQVTCGHGSVLLWQHCNMLSILPVFFAWRRHISHNGRARIAFQLPQNQLQQMHTSLRQHAYLEIRTCLQVDQSVSKLKSTTVNLHIAFLWSTSNALCVQVGSKKVLRWRVKVGQDYAFKIVRKFQVAGPA